MWGGIIRKNLPMTPFPEKQCDGYSIYEHAALAAQDMPTGRAKGIYRVRGRRNFMLRSLKIYYLFAI